MIEDYGRFLKKKAKSILSEERVRVEPFTTSILDGIDMRETIRNWHERKIYVRQFDRLHGEVGAVVVIFDEDTRGPLHLPDHLAGRTPERDRDMAFYSTHPFDNIVGPGIGRAEYGGFLMTLPPRRMFDVWSDGDYEFAESKPERLLMAALDYSMERYVVYVAAKPPRSIFRSIAAHLNRKIIYVPIGQLSPTKLKKVRVVHVLDSYDAAGEREGLHLVAGVDTAACSVKIRSEGNMSVNLHSLKQTEDRVKRSLTSALNSTFVLYMVLLMIIALGFVLAPR